MKQENKTNLKGEAMEKKEDIERLILDCGYESLSDFRRKTNIPLAFETIRRASKSGDVNTYTLFLILKYLGLSPGRIKNILESFGDKELSVFIGSESDLTDKELAGLACCRKIRNIRPAFTSHFADFLKMSADMAGVDVSGEIQILRGE